MSFPSGRPHRVRGSGDLGVIAGEVAQVAAVRPPHGVDVSSTVGRRVRLKRQRATVRGPGGVARVECERGHLTFLATV